MKNKYNLVYVPLNISKEITKIAQRFATYADQYLLGNHALPHVTLYQFEAYEEDLPQIWSATRKNIHAKFMSLRFNKFSIYRSTPLLWISLLPDQGEELHALHQQVLKALDVKDQVRFDPHMTLLNSVNENVCVPVDDFAKTFTGLHDDFALALGKSGFAGQFKEIIFCEKIT